MLAYTVRRVIATIPVMAIVALFVFSLLYIAPGDPAAIIAGDQATPDDVERIRAGLGLDRPFLIRFGEWFWHVLNGDLGVSIFTNLPVTRMIAQRIEPTLSLMSLTLILSIAIAVPMGVTSAWKATQAKSAIAGLNLMAALLAIAGLVVVTVMDLTGLETWVLLLVALGIVVGEAFLVFRSFREQGSIFDRLKSIACLLGFVAGTALILSSRGLIEPARGPGFSIGVYLVLFLVFLNGAQRAGPALDRSLMAVSVFGFSVPVFVVGYLLAYVFALQLEWLPVQGYTPIDRGLWPWLSNLILPSVALGSVYIALIARITRATMLEVLSQDYVRTAKAKGVSSTTMLFVHALKNAAIPIVTVIGIGVALLIGGSVVTESVFAIPGLGRLVVDAILRRDYPVIQGVILLFSFTYVLVNLGVDLLYTVFDPRIRY